MPNQQPWIVVSNRRSGDGKQLPALRAALQQCQRKVDLRVAKSGRTLKRLIRRAAADAKASDALLVLHGGDGTLNFGAAVALQHDLPVAMLPGGTFNYYTRELGIPANLERAVQALRAGDVAAVDIATVNDEPFLLNLSLGLHSRLLRERERDMRQLGRSQWVAAWSVLKGLLRRQAPVRLRLVDGDESQRVRAAALTVIRSPLQMCELGLPEAAESDLALMLSAAQSRWALLRAALHLRLRQPHAEPTLSVRRAMQFELHASGGRPNRRIRLAIDGESRRLALPLSIAVLPQRLRILRPGKLD